MVLSSRANKFVNARSLVTIFWEGRVVLRGTGRVGWIRNLARIFFSFRLLRRKRWIDTGFACKLTQHSISISSEIEILIFLAV